MKNLIATKSFTGLAAIVLALAVGATVPSTQALAQAEKVMANVPFDFQNGSEHLPAGRYVIGMDSVNLMKLQSNTVTSLTLSRAEIDDKPAAGSKLIFRKYGNRYFLREVWLANKSAHQVLPKSKAEKRQQNALNVTERNGMEVALLEPLH